MAVASRPIFRSAREVGAFYRSALAEELAGRAMRSTAGPARRAAISRSRASHADLLEAFSGRSREVARAAERFRARYGRAPERGELRNVELENRRAKELTTREDLQRVWSETPSVTSSARTRQATDRRRPEPADALSGRSRIGSRRGSRAAGRVRGQASCARSCWSRQLERLSPEQALAGGAGDDPGPASTARWRAGG